AVRLSAGLRVANLPRTATDRVYPLAAPRSAVTPDRGDARGGAAIAAPAPVPAQPSPQGIRQRSRVARRHVGAHHVGGSRGLLRVVPRLPLLSGLHRPRLHVRRGFRRIALPALSAGAEAPSCRSGPPRGRVRGALLTRGVAPRSRRLRSR